MMRMVNVSTHKIKINLLLSNSNNQCQLRMYLSKKLELVSIPTLELFLEMYEIQFQRQLATSWLKCLKKSFSLSFTQESTQVLKLLKPLESLNILQNVVSHWHNLLEHFQTVLRFFRETLSKNFSL